MKDVRVSRVSLSFFRSKYYIAKMLVLVLALVLMALEVPLRAPEFC